MVLHFDGDRHAQLRMVRALKNRFGPTDEIGCFELGEYGLTELPDPSGLFLSRLQRPGAGHLRDRHPGGPAPAAGRGADPGLRGRGGASRAG